MGSVLYLKTRKSSAVKTSDFQSASMKSFDRGCSAKPPQLLSTWLPCARSSSQAERIICNSNEALVRSCCLKKMEAVFCNLVAAAWSSVLGMGASAAIAACESGAEPFLKSCAMQQWRYAPSRIVKLNAKAGVWVQFHSLIMLIVVRWRCNNYPIRLTHLHAPIQIIAHQTIVHSRIISRSIRRVPSFFLFLFNFLFSRQISAEWLFQTNL
jgi:hypothetical protein